jgi:CRISPR-associated exonuclease Cas4
VYSLGAPARLNSAKPQTRGDIRIARGLMLRSLRLGLTGKADVVEFHRAADGSAVPFPVEYKRGQPKRNFCDHVQLCAQALCLEEMLSVSIPAGALFYGRTRRRLDLPFDAQLRALTEQTVTQLHELIASGVTPSAIREKKCERCSLLHLCLPDAADRGRHASRYLDRTLTAMSAAPAAEGDAP